MVIAQYMGSNIIKLKKLSKDRHQMSPPNVEATAPSDVNDSVEVTKFFIPILLEKLATYEHNVLFSRLLKIHRLSYRSSS